jgi:Flp pilus assembly protein TadD
VQEAFETARALVAAFPDDPRGLEQLASVLADAGDVQGLTDVTNEIARRSPGSWAAAYYDATLAFLRDAYEEAARRGEQAAAVDPRDARALNLVGAARASLGDTAGARNAFEQSLRRNPRDATPYVNLGRLELASGDTGKAVALFAEAVVLDPASSEARRGFDEATAAAAVSPQ